MKLCCYILVLYSDFHDLGQNLGRMISLVITMMMRGNGDRRLPLWRTALPIRVGQSIRVRVLRLIFDVLIKRDPVMPQIVGCLVSDSMQSAVLLPKWGRVSPHCPSRKFHRGISFLYNFVILHSLFFILYLLYSFLNTFIMMIIALLASLVAFAAAGPALAPRGSIVGTGKVTFVLASIISPQPKDIFADTTSGFWVNTAALDEPNGQQHFVWDPATNFVTTSSVRLFPFTYYFY